MRLEGKIAVVTGGTSGIGRRVVERFREEGAEVVFTGRRAGLGSEVAGATGATFVEADTASVVDAERTIKQTLGAYGRIDILMNWKWAASVWGSRFRRGVGPIATLALCGARCGASRGDHCA